MSQSLYSANMQIITQNKVYHKTFLRFLPNVQKLLKYLNFITIHRVV